MTTVGPVLRLFEVHARAGCIDALLQKFATTSAEVVRDEPGNIGYFFGRIVENDGKQVIFASMWKDMAALKERFGDEWQSSYLPAGYEDLIEECSVRHFDLGAGWHVHDS